MARETLRFDDLNPYLLLKNGNFLYKVPFRGGWAVLKVYYGSRGFWGRLQKSWDNVVMSGQTSYWPKTRLRVEQECLAAWRKHGFRVFETYPEVEVIAPQAPPGGYLLFEYVDKPKIATVLQDQGRPLEERWALYRRFLKEWSRRHALAIAAREPRLVHENGDGKHVMILDDQSMLWFDFEMVWRSRKRIVQHVAHEINQYIWYLSGNVAPDMTDRFIEETVEHYPDRERLYEPYNYFFRHPNLVHRWARMLDRKFKKKARGPRSKYGIARQLKEHLDRR